jgi:hypothetical protein
VACDRPGLSRSTTLGPAVLRQPLLEHCDTSAMATENRLDAAMEVVLPDVRQGGVVPYRIVNTGTINVICGSPYRLERQTDDGWMPVNGGMPFRLIGFGVRPGRCHELQARIPDDAPGGLYRLVASVGSDHVSGRVEICGEFSITIES